MNRYHTLPYNGCHIISKKVLVNLPEHPCHLPRPTVPTIGSKPYYHWSVFHIKCKQVLLNLLIAMMASTYQKTLEKSQLKILLDSYDIAHNASYICQSGAVKGGEEGKRGAQESGEEIATVA